MMKHKIAAAMLLLMHASVSFASSLEIERKFSLGAMAASGNSQSISLNSGFFLNTNIRHSEEFTLKGNFDWGRTSGTDNLMKAGSALRHGISLDRQKYFFYSIEAEHDRFRGVDLRIAPMAGVGHWFLDGKDISSMAEISAGYQGEIGAFGQKGQSGVEARQFFRVRLSSGSELSNDIKINLADLGAGNIRVVDTLSIKSRINDLFNLKVALNNDYSTNPPPGIGNNDLLFTTSIEYAYKQVKER